MGAVPPPHSINFQDEQASDKDPSHIPFHRIHPSLNVSIFAAHFSTHRIGNRPFLRPGVDNDDDNDYNRQRAFRPGGGPGTFAEWADDVVRYVGITPCVRR